MDPALSAAIITATVTITIALIGYLITYWSNMFFSQRAERLSRINRQLCELYGPMYSLVNGGNRAWVAFRTKHRNGIPYFADQPPPTDADLEAWRLWVTTVFMPNNCRLHELILSKADLIMDAEMPNCLKNLCAHVAAYQVVLKKWEKQDFSDHISIIPYPAADLIEYCRGSFTHLKKEQAKLLGKG